jgi:hypothetical protein
MVKLLRTILPKPIKRYIKKQIFKVLRISPDRDLRTSVETADLGPPGPLINDVFIPIKSVPGYFNVDDTSHFHLVLSMQIRIGLKGDFLEIGSYHGRSSAVMARYLNKDEKFHICDAFQADTEDYYDDKPTVQKLISNIKRLSPDIQDERMVIHSCLSNELKLPKSRRFRFVHIDGGHSEEQTLFDLNLVKNQLIVNGIVAVDDYHHRYHPGVAKAVDNFLADNEQFSVLADLNRHGAIGRKIYVIRTQ